MKYNKLFDYLTIAWKIGAGTVPVCFSPVFKIRLYRTVIIFFF